jgi:hypothetical protein
MNNKKTKTWATGFRIREDCFEINKRELFLKIFFLSNKTNIFLNFERKLCKGISGPLISRSCDL